MSYSNIYYQISVWLGCGIILGGGDSGPVGCGNSKLFPSAVQESHSHVHCLGGNAQTKLKSMSQL